MAFVPDNELEKALMRAAGDAAARPLFYKLLLESDLFVIGETGRKGADGGRFDMQEGDHLRIASMTYNGENCLPVFTSLTRLKTFVREETGYVGLNGRSLFEMTKGAHFLLNPGADYGKDLTPQEIATLLDPAAPARVTVEHPTQVLIGQPAEYPQALVDALCASFSGMSGVISAYLAQIAYEGSSEPPHLLIGVETEGDGTKIFTEIGRIAGQIAHGQTLDLVPIDRKKRAETLAAALLDTEPFYRRSPGTVQ